MKPSNKKLPKTRDVTFEMVTAKVSLERHFIPEVDWEPCKVFRGVTA